MSQTNKDVVRRALEEQWENIGVLDELLSESYIAYDPSRPEPILGREGAKAQTEMYLAAFPDARITVDEQLAKGDLVATRWTGRGTHRGELMGAAPTGKEVTVTGIDISRVEGGRIVEVRSSWDTLGMLVQLGAVPEPARA